MTSVIADTIAVLVSSAILFLVAAGLNITFGVLGVINVAHGSFYMYGAFLVTSLIMTYTQSGGWSILLAIPAAVAIGLLAAVVEVVLIRPLYRRDHLAQLLVTYGLFLVLDDLALHVWGSNERSANFSGWLKTDVVIGGAVVPASDLLIIGLAAFIAIVAWWFLNHRPIGSKLRAIVEDRDLATLAGINVRKLYTLVFVTGAVVAAFTGALAVTVQSIGPGLDESILVQAFVVAVIGGLGSFAGAAVGSLIIAAFQQIVINLAPSMEGYVIYALLLAVLVIRPTGLFGAREL